MDSKESIPPAYIGLLYRETIPGLLSGELGFSKYLPVCSAQTRTGMGHLRRPPGVELIPTID